MNELIFNWQGQLMIFAQVALAGLLGGLIGMEREWAHKAAGLRTHMLVGAAAALFVLLGPELAIQFSRRAEGVPTRSDALRVMQAIITGIAFLGGGTIVFHSGKELVEGLTTASSILMTSAIGMTVGIGLWALATALTLLVFFVLRGLGVLELRWGWGSRARTKREEDTKRPPGGSP